MGMHIYTPIEMLTSEMLACGMLTSSAWCIHSPARLYDEEHLAHWRLLSIV